MRIMQRKFPLLPLLFAALLTGCSPAPAVPEETQPVTETAEPPAETTPEPTTEPPTEPPTTPPETEPPTEPPYMTGQTEAFEVFTAVTVQEFVTDCNVELTAPEVLLDTETPGTHEIAIPYRQGRRTGELTLSYSVVDTTPPVVLNDGSDAYVLTGQPFEPDSLVGYADNCDPHPVLTCEGAVDTNTPGTYAVTATVTDSSGNGKSWNFSVDVVDQKPADTDNRTRVNFGDFAAAYAGEGRTFGIDVSKWQGAVDFQAVKQAGCSFVMLRAGYGGGEIKADEYFQTNLANALAAGLDTGVYFYSTARTEEEARAQAEWVIANLNGTPLQLPVAFDWESFSHFQQYGMSLHDLNALFTVFSDTLKAAGYPAMLYSSRLKLGEVWTNPAQNPVWLAHYVQHTDYTGDFLLWQQSSCGRIAGISGDVDLNIRFS